MATLTVTATHNYTGEILDTDPIDRIEFQAGPSKTATFDASQFGTGNGLIASNVVITGVGTIAVGAITGTFSAAAWQLSSFTGQIQLSGTNASETITGSSGHDVFGGAGGADILNGGDGDDVFAAAGGNIAAGETIDGGDGTDALNLSSGHDLTLAGTSVVNVETIRFLGDGASLIASGTHFGGPGDFTTISSAGGSNAQSLTVNGTFVDLSGVAFTGWGGASQTITINGTDASFNILVGSSERDTISATINSSNLFTGGGGADTLNGGAGSELFRYLATGDVVAGEVIAGGGATDHLLLSGDASHDFSLASITDVETLEFFVGTIAATFSGTQFGVGAIVNVDGGTGTDTLIVNVDSVTTNLSGVDFASWTDGTDTITINGTAAGENITGSDKNDTITGGGGTDGMNGGDGDDTFVYTVGADFGGLETIDGENGSDRILVIDTAIDLAPSPLSNIARVEQLEFSGTGSSGATLFAGDIGSAAGRINTVTGSSGTNALTISPSTDASLSGVTFNSWTAGVDTITINGTNSVDTLTGSNKNDTIIGGDGADAMHGGDGDDVFLYTGFNQAAGVETLDGGDGFDIIRSASAQDFSPSATLTSIEGLEFAGGGVGVLAFRANQFGGGGISNIVAVTGNVSFNQVQVNLSAPATFSAAGWTFSNWTDGTDEVFLIGSSGLDTITGSSRQDLIRGSGGADVLSGGDGDDRFIYGAGEAFAGQQVSGGAGIDTLFITNIASFADIAVSGVERVQFGEDFVPTVVTFKGTQIGTGNITQIAGSTEVDVLVVNAASDVDLSGLTFTSWTNGADTITINGTAAAETLTGSSRNDAINGGGGSDTAVFSGNRSSYTLQVVDDAIVIAGLDGTDTLSSIEHLQFADGTLNLDDGNALFDTPFYFSQNLDVFQFGLDALFHFNVVGFHEGRDPNAFFDTSGYLAANPDVAASGVNPLDHFHQFGWKQGRDPGPDFDTTLYLINNPDVAAAGIDPLEHFLQSGQSEGRQAFAAVGQSIVGGFDAQFYLFDNPDVAAAGVDPLFHYNVAGRFEGRDPNAWFDTAGYLSRYSDVAAAGINPLSHYEAVGWTEGRDPSAGFDTLGYLAANPDVAAANINPLDHFLKFGIYEGRTAVNDGVFF